MRRGVSERGARLGVWLLGLSQGCESTRLRSGSGSWRQLSSCSPNRARSRAPDGASVYAVTRSMVEDGDSQRRARVRRRREEWRLLQQVRDRALPARRRALCARPPACGALPPPRCPRASGRSHPCFRSRRPSSSCCSRSAAGSERVCGRRSGRPGSGCGTFLIVYTKEFYGEPVVALFLVVALERALAGRPGQSGAALAAGALVRPEAFRSPSCSFRFSGSHEASRRSSAAGVPPLGVPRLHGRVQRFPIRRRRQTGYGDAKPRISAWSRGRPGCCSTRRRACFFRAGRRPRPPCVHSSLADETAAPPRSSGDPSLSLPGCGGEPGVGGGWTWGPRHLIAIVPGAVGPLCALAR